MPTELGRRTLVDVSFDQGTTWLSLGGKTDVSPQITPTKQDATTYETNGIKSVEITLQDAVVVVKLLNESNASNVLDPTQVALNGLIGSFGTAARCWIRWYDNQGRAGNDNWKMYAVVEKSPSGTSVDGLDEDTFTFTVDGQLSRITNPFAAALAPVVLAATPGGAAAGALVQITGQGFATATLVKFAAVTVTVYQILGDTVIEAVMPAGSAGSAPVTVTNPIGVSNSLAYTRA